MSGLGYERRKQVRVEMRRDLIVAPQEYRGQPVYVLKDPVRLRYFRLKATEHFLVTQLNGRHTLEEARVALERRERPRRIRLEEVEAFARQLITDGLAHPAPVHASRQLLEQGRQFHRQERWNRVANVLSLRVPLCDPDAHLGWLARRLRWLLSPASLFLSLVAIVAALLLVTVHFRQLHARLPSPGDFFSLSTAVYVWIAIALAKILHELGHGLSCKAFGGEVHEMGLMLLCLAPCLYCDVSDAWTFPSKWRRMFVSFAGIYVELLIAALATFVWWFTPDSLPVNRLCLSLMIVCSVNTLTLNGNPLLRYDGYYALSDWLEIANLHVRSRAALLGIIVRQGFGIMVRDPETTTLPRRLGLAGFGAASVAYRWVVTVGMVLILHQILKPYRLVSVGVPVALLAIAAGGVICLYRAARNAARQGRFAEVKPYRLILGVGSSMALAACLVALPLPIGHVRQTGLLAFHPDSAEAVHVTVPGVLTRVCVREGQRVAAGDLLAEFENRELEEAYAGQEAADSVRAVRHAFLEGRTRAAPDVQAEVRAALAGSEQFRTARRTAHFKELVDRLQLRAPRSGVVVGLPDPGELGRRWSLQGEKPFCTIGDPDRLWLLVPLSAADYRRVRDEREAPVVMAIPGCPDPHYSCRIVRFPEAKNDVLPPALTTPRGGPVEVCHHASENARPVAPQFLVALEFLGPTPAARPGQLVPVVFRCRWETAASWLYETLAASVGAKLF